MPARAAVSIVFVAREVLRSNTETRPRLIVGGALLVGAAVGGVVGGVRRPLLPVLPSHAPPPSSWARQQPRFLGRVGGSVALSGGSRHHFWRHVVIEPAPLGPWHTLLFPRYHSSWQRKSIVLLADWYAPISNTLPTASHIPLLHTHSLLKRIGLTVNHLAGIVVSHSLLTVNPSVPRWDTTYDLLSRIQFFSDFFLDSEFDLYILQLPHETLVGLGDDPFCNNKPESAAEGPFILPHEIGCQDG